MGNCRAAYGKLPRVFERIYDANSGGVASPNCGCPNLFTKGCNPRLYVYVPSALASAIGLEAGEKVQWTLLDRNNLQMERSAPAPIKKTRASKKEE